MGEAAYKKQVGVLEYDSDDWTDDGEWDGSGDLDEEDWFELPATSADLTVEGDTLDDTDLRTTGTRSRIIGLLDWNVSGTLNYEPDNDGFDRVKKDFFGRNIIVVRYLPEGTTKLENGYCGLAVVETFSHSGGVEDLETVDFTFPSTSQLVDGEGNAQ